MNNVNFEVPRSELLKYKHPFGTPIIPLGHIILYMGYPLVPIKNGNFIAFVKCDFCGQDDHLIENGRCGHCGGWIS